MPNTEHSKSQAPKPRIVIGTPEEASEAPAPHTSAVEAKQAAEPSSKAAPKPAPEPAATPSAATPAAATRPRRSFSETVSTARAKGVSVFEVIAPGHGNALFFGLLGLLFALLVFWIGPLRAFFVAFMVLIGVAAGQYLDGDPKIINSIRRLFDRDE